MSGTTRPPEVDDGDAPSPSGTLAEILAPSWDRLRATVLVLVPMLGVLAIFETFRIPQPGIAVFLLLMIARGDMLSTIGSSFTVAVSVSLGALLAIVTLAFCLSEPALRIPVMALMVFTTMLLVRATTLGPIAFLIGFFSINGITLADQILGLAGTPADITNTEGFGRPQGSYMPPEEVLLHALLWLSMAAVIPAGLLAFTARVLGADPRALLLRKFRARSDAATAFCRAEIGASGQLYSVAREGIASLLSLMGAAERSGRTARLHAVHLRLVRGFNRLMLLLVAWDMVRSSDTDDTAFLRPIGDFTAALADRLHTRGGTRKVPLPPPPGDGIENALDGALPALAAAIRDVQIGLREAEAARSDTLYSNLPTAPSPRRPFLQPNAFGAANVRFALKVTLTVMTAYLIEVALNWPAISTCMISCLFIALGTVGETLYKMTLRITGCVVGAVLGIGSILFLMPSMTTFGQLAALFLPVAFISAWIAFGSPRIAYAGWQMLLAFALTVLQGFGPTLDMETARDRVIGILLGNVVVAVVFLCVWPVRVGDALRRDMAAALDILGRIMAIEGGPATDVRRGEEAALRDGFSAALARVGAVMPNDRFEPANPHRSGGGTSGSLGRTALARLSRLVVPVSVIATDGVDPEPRDAMPPEWLDHCRAFHRSMTEWFGQAAIWVRTGKNHDCLRDALPHPPMAPVTADSLSPAVARHLHGRIALYELLLRQIDEFLDVAMPTHIRHAAPPPTGACRLPPGETPFGPGRIGKPIVPVLLLAALAGCGDTRDLAPPDPATPWRPVVSTDGDTFRPARGVQAAGAHSMATASRDFHLPADAGLPFANPHTTIDPSHTYSLVELIDIAERDNKETRIAWEQARQAAIGVGLSEAAFLPALSATAMGGFRHETTPSPVPAGYVTSDTEGFFPTLTLSYLLFDFGARDAALRAARESSEAANVSFTAAHQQLILSVTRAFLSFAAASAQVDAAQSALRNAGLLLTAAQARLNNGEGTVTDTDDAHSAQAQARYAIASAQATRLDARDALLVALGLPPHTPLNVEPLADQPVPTGLRGDLDGLMHQALQSRPDLLASLARLRGAEADTARARAALYPTLSLSTNITGDIGRIQVEGISAHSFQQEEAGVYLDFKWNLYQGGTLANQVRLAESREAESRDTLQQAEDRAMQQVATAYDELDAGLSQYDAARAQVDATRTAFDSDTEAFRRGEGTSTGAETAAAAFDQANANLARAHAQVLASAATLAFATGQLTSVAALPAS